MVYAKGAASLLILFIAISSHNAATFLSTPRAQDAVDWSTMNANFHGTNFVPQDQIRLTNVNDLTLEWLFPIPSSGEVQGLNVTGDGSISPPLIVGGIVYIVTNYLRVYAINSATGNVLWAYDSVLDTKGLPLGYLSGHVHGINYYQGKVWVSLPDCSVHALDALTGSLVLKISRICADIPGNGGRYDSSGTPPVFNRDIMLWTSSVSEGTDSGRGFVAAYNLTTKQLLWRWFVTPSAGGDSQWDFTSCRQESCHGNVAPYARDWGTMGTEDGRARPGAGPSWGQPAVDERRGVFYVATSQPSPDWNATYRPGPNLYSDSVVALNATNGNMIWFFQTTPHDLYDFDCGWNVVLGNVMLDGRTNEAIFKACKNGYVYALDAVSGSLLWFFNPPSVKRLGTENADYVVTSKYNATIPWINYPSTSQFKQCPGSNGAVESDVAFAYGKLFVAAHNFCTFGQVGPVEGYASNEWGVRYLQPDWRHANTTIYALDASSGKVVWSYFIPDIPFRGWLTASGGLLFVSSLDGNIHALNADNGNKVYSLHLGPSLYGGPTLGSSLSGDVVLLQLVGSPSYGAFSERVPGALLAFGLRSPITEAWTTYLIFAAAGFTGAVATLLIIDRIFRRRRVPAKRSD